MFQFNEHCGAKDMDTELILYSLPYTWHASPINIESVAVEDILLLIHCSWWSFPLARLEVPPGDQDEDQRVVDPYVTWTDDDQLFATSYYSRDGQHP
jgi:hypothetical protein